MSGKRIDNKFSLIATVVMKKDEDSITLKSSEVDFVMSLAELRGVVDTNGEYEFKHLKDTKQYDDDSEYLAEVDKSRIEKATKEIMSGEFSFPCHPRRLVDDLLVQTRNVKKSVQVLKKDYHHILAAVVLESMEMLKTREALIKKYPEAKMVADGVERILMTFRFTGNALKDYKLYRNYVNFDIDELGNRMSAQLPSADDTVKDFVKRRKVNAEMLECTPLELDRGIRYS